MTSLLKGVSKYIDSHFGHSSGDKKFVNSNNNSINVKEEKLENNSYNDKIEKGVRVKDGKIEIKGCGNIIPCRGVELYINDDKFPPNIVESVSFKATTRNASILLSNVYNATTVIKLDNPSFAPGVTNGTGIILSNICKTNACATNNPMYTILLVFRIKPTSNEII